MNQPIVAEHGKGMATSKPATVVISAAATPGAMAAISAFPCWAMRPKVPITPQTVPSSLRRAAADGDGEQDQAGFQLQ